MSDNAVLIFELPSNTFQALLSLVLNKVGSSSAVVVKSDLSPPNFVVSLAPSFVNWLIGSLPSPIKPSNNGQRPPSGWGNFETDFV